MTFNGSPITTNPVAWIMINCGEIQINDSPDGDPRKTGSIYGFAALVLDSIPIGDGRGHR